MGALWLLVVAIALPTPPSVPPSALAQSPQVDGHSPVEVRLVAEAQTLARGEAVRLGVHFTLAPGWHIYWQNPGGAGFPTEIVWRADGIKLAPLHWPPPRLFHETDDIVTYGYTDEALLVVPAMVARDAPATLQLAADVKFLACNTICSPGAVHVERSFAVADARVPAAPDTLAAFERFDLAPPGDAAQGQLTLWGQSVVTLLQMVALAFVGGMILNLMPCVLPVLALKALSLVRTAPGPRAARRHAAGYVIGVVGSMLALAAMVVLLRGWGHRVGWGFQFQSPGFVAALAAILLLLALNCFGVFELTVGVERLERAQQRAHGMGQSALEGVLAVLVSTPCSAPALGTAIAFALAQPGWVVALIFLAVGAGLALPFALVVLIPGLRRRLPKPGPWMQLLKELFGYALIASALWLVWVFCRLTDADSLARLMALLWLGALGAGMTGRLLQTRPERTAPALGVLALLLVGLAQHGPLCLWPVSAEAAEAAMPMAYSRARLDAELKAGHPVLVDFTADWCITCKYNERHVLGAPEVMTALAKAQVVTLRADWTRRDPALLEELMSHGRAGVPMVLLYDPRAPGQPQLLPEVMSSATLLAALGKL